MVKRTAWQAERIRMMRNEGSRMLRCYAVPTGKWYRNFEALLRFHLQGQKVLEIGFPDPEDKGTTNLRNVVTIY
jgi:hypothetical protein